ncbi:MAG: redoxin family protein [Pirellulales bacterium]|nr:redoxin family protein [Pirellulales bacterium]
MESAPRVENAVRSKRSSVWVDFAPFGAIALVLAMIVLGGRAADRAPIAKGTPLPRIDAAGWLNLPAGKAFDPTGRVAVVDCWATWCAPCRAALPELARIARKYRPLGVEFVGLTRETERDVDVIRRVIRETDGFDWPVGYGVERFYRELKVEFLPTLIVFDRDGKATYSHAGAGGEAALEAALDAALAR